MLGIIPSEETQSSVQELKRKCFEGGHMRAKNQGQLINPNIRPENQGQLINPNARIKINFAMQRFSFTS
jgi:hypothetical protein